MYRLTRGAEKLPTPPVLDPAQRAVVDHVGGPLLVLAGPGTGKTTTLVECVVDRIERRGATPDSILVLTFSRKAAADLRARIPLGGRLLRRPLADEKACRLAPPQHGGARSGISSVISDPIHAYG